MSTSDQELPALGQPDVAPDPQGDSDFAAEHDSTAVDDKIMTGDEPREPARPTGWAGLDKDGAP